MFPVLLALALAAPPQDPVPVRVDARVELLTLVFRLIGAAEFEQPSSRSPYADEIELWFGPAREHEVFQRARSLRSQHGIGFNAVPDLAVHLTDPPALALRVPLEPWPERLDARWKGADVEGFLVALRRFAEETSYLEFFASTSEAREAAERSLTKEVERAKVLPWLRSFFGLAPGTSYTAVPGLLCGPGNFGASVRLADGTLELWPILGASHWDAAGHALYDPGILSTVVHEFTHAFSNPVVDRHWAALEPAFERLFPSVATVMATQAYASPRTVAYESLVRACVVRHAATHHGAAAAERQAQSDASRGFAWTADLAKLLERYEAERAKYPDLDAFGPELARFFEELSRKSPAPAAAPR